GASICQSHVHRAHALIQNLFQMDAGYLPTRGEQTEFRQSQKPFRGLGQRAEPVAELLPEIFKLFQSAKPCQPAIDLDSQALPGDEITRQVCFPGQVDRDFQWSLERLVPEPADSVLQKLAIKLVTDSRDMPGLLRSEDVPCSAYLQVAHRDLEAGAEFREL